MADLTNDFALDWDLKEAPADDGSHGAWRVLEPGYYPFTVRSLERTHFQGSAKMPPCPQAKLVLSVTDTDGADAAVRVNLFLANSMLWKIARFMECIGHGRDANGKVVIDWGGVEGAVGWAKVSKRTYTGRDGQPRESNDVEEFCLPGKGQEAAYAAYEAACAQAQGAVQAAPRAQAVPAQQAPVYAPQAAQAGTYPGQAANAANLGTSAHQAGYQQQPTPAGVPAPQGQTQAQAAPWGIQ